MDSFSDYSDGRSTRKSDLPSKLDFIKYAKSIPSVVICEPSTIDEPVIEYAKYGSCPIEYAKHGSCTIEYAKHARDAKYAKHA